MKKNVFFIVMILFVVVIMVSGCQLGKNVDPNKEAEQTLKYGTDIYKGNEGLVVKFIKDVPPRRVYSSEPLIVGLEVHNRGANSIEQNNAYIYLSGADPTIVQFVNVNGISIGNPPVRYVFAEDLPGKEEILGEGGYTTVTFDTGNNLLTLPKGTDTYKPRFIATVCYKYETDASPVVCLDPNPYGTFTSDRSCEIRSVSISGGQGAPVAITRIEQTPQKYATQLKIHLKNVGRGKVIDSQKLSTCNRVEAQDYNLINRLDGYYVKIGSAEFDSTTGGSAGGIISCQPSSVRLVNDEAIIICRYNFPAEQQQSAFTSPIVIQLFYSYIESTQPQEVEILNI